MPGQGASNGLVSVFACLARGHRRVRRGVVRFSRFTRGNPCLSASIELMARSAEPFGLAASSLTAGGLRDKWLGVQRRLDDEMVQLALCEGDREGCVSPAALKFLDIVDAARLRDGRARLGEINRAINLAIRPMSDLAQHGRIDVWSSPLATLTAAVAIVKTTRSRNSWLCAAPASRPKTSGSWSCTTPSTATTTPSRPHGWMGAG